MSYGGYGVSAASVKVEKVDNGYVLKAGTSKPQVCEGHGTKKLAEMLAKIFGVKESVPDAD